MEEKRGEREKEVLDSKAEVSIKLFAETMDVSAAMRIRENDFIFANSQQEMQGYSRLEINYDHS